MPRLEMTAPLEPRASSDLGRHLLQVDVAQVLPERQRERFEAVGQNLADVVGRSAGHTPWTSVPMQILSAVSGSFGCGTALRRPVRPQPPTPVAAATAAPL